MSRRRLSRREVLAGVAAGSIGTIAGCSRVVYDDVLRLEVLEVQRLGRVFAGEVRLLNAPFHGEREEPYATRYDGVSIVGYAQDLAEAFRVDVGDVAPDTSLTESFSSDRFPFLLTADAEAVTTDADYAVDHGAEMYAYDGLSDDASTGSDGGSSHVWKQLRRRRISDPLPPPAGVVEYHKCRQRVRWRETNGTEPNLSLVPGSEQWLEREIPPPTVQRQVYFLTYNYSERVRDPPEGARHVELEALPTELRQAVEQERYPGYMNHSEFFRTLDLLPGETPRNVSAFPPCTAAHVSCSDTRGENCVDGGGRFAGDLYKTLEYTTSRGNATYAVAAIYHEKWAPPGAEPLGPCSDERSESVSIHAYDRDDRYTGLGRAVEGERVVPELATFIDRYWAKDHPYLPNMDPSMETFERILDGLEGRPTPVPLDCGRPNVICSNDPTVHCGKGTVDAYYYVDVDGRRTWLRLEYRWRGLPEPSAEEPDE